MNESHSSAFSRFEPMEGSELFFSSLLCSSLPVTQWDCFCIQIDNGADVNVPSLNQRDDRQATPLILSSRFDFVEILAQ